MGQPIGRMFIVVLLSIVQLAGWAPGAVARDKTINREILGLFDSSTEGRSEELRLHQLLEMPLNHLGYKLKLHDVAHGLPDLAQAKRYHAVATWFSGRLNNAEAYLTWAEKVAHSGTRFIILDSIGALGEKEDIALINAFLKHLGLAYAAYYVGDATETRIKFADPSMIDFEHKLDPLKLPGHQVIISKSPAMHAHLTVTDPAHRWAGANASTLVATGSKGGIAATGFAIHYETGSDQVRWIINPFAFLQAALGGKHWPIPDTTTVSGRRLYFSHIDGDGWNNITEVFPYSSERASSAEVVLDALIAPYPDLPVSVGLIAGDIDPTLGGKSTTAGVAEVIFAMPHVEVASHTYTHPYNWEYYENYNRDREVADVLEFASTAPAYDDRSLTELVASWRSSKQVETVALAATPHGEHEESASLPRARPHEVFNLGEEVHGALDVASELAPPEKPARLYLWSGNTRPFEAAVRATREAGARNLNGGDSRFDSLFPSAGYVAPISRTVGQERQIYAVNSNENTYTNGWTGPFDAFKLLSETLDNTEQPRRLKGFNLYYHVFSATKHEGLEVIVRHLDRARASPIAPITASRYAAIAEGFFSAQITEVGPGRWRVGQRGDLQTVRFEQASALDVDYQASKGVIGHNRHGDALYLTLDAAVAEAIVALRPVQKYPDRRERHKAVPHLIDSRWHLSKVTRSACDVRADVQGFGAGEMNWAGFPAGQYEIAVSRLGEPITTLEATADDQGRLAFRAEADVIAPAQLQISCRRPARSPL